MKEKKKGHGIYIHRKKGGRVFQNEVSKIEYFLNDK